MRNYCAVIALSFAIAAAASASDAPPNDVEHNARRAQEFARFNPRYQEMKAERTAEIRTLNEKVEQREAAGENTECSHQIVWELRLLLYMSADFAAMDRRIADARAVLAHPEREAEARKQNPEDGAWGACYESWPFKLYASYEHRNDKDAKPFRLLDRVNSPEKLTAYLTGLATSDIAKTGFDLSFDLNESIADLMRLILRDQPKGYAWDPRLKRTIMDLLLKELRNPETGWWGEKYVRDGKVKFVDDLSITFHVISFLDGKVPDLGKTVDTALALKTIEAPAGWLWQGGYWNHNNMDVAVIFRFSWPAANESQRESMRLEIQKMLRWCLAESLQADGSFKPLISDGSLEEANYFGAAFLARIGYFDRTRRFWTDAEFPEAEGIRRRVVENIQKRLKSGGAGGSYYRSILEELR